jgi:hypothetical protein
MASYGTDDKKDAVNTMIVEDQKRPEDQDDDDFLLTARKRFFRAMESESMNRKDAIDDLEFKNGNQWPAQIRTQRTLEKRPCLTINKMKTFVHQVTNNLRQNRPAINISPVGDGADKNTAQMLKGLIRQIERESNADIAYDTGFDSAASNGWGYWRVLNEYEDDTSFNQVIRIQRIRNPFRVYLDPDHQMPDGADAKWAFISDLVPRDEFKEMYPNADPIPWDQGGQGDDNFKDWSTQTHVRVAEYFCFKTEKRKLIAIDPMPLPGLEQGFSGTEDELPEGLAELIKDEAMRKQLVSNEREVDAQIPHWSKITAHQVLEEQRLPGKYFGIVKCIGDEVDIEGKVTYAGIIRDAKDPQRMKNYWAALALDTKLPTPSGWTTMREVRVGDELFSETGVRCKVTGVSPIYINHDCFRIDFDDGSHIVADSTHRWQVESLGKRYSDGYRWETKIVTTEELSKEDHRIYSAKPLELDAVDLPIHPYLLGAWLGDGDTSAAVLTQGNDDIEDFRAKLESCGLSLGPNMPCSGGSANRFTVYGVRKEFIRLGLFGSKHIPGQYLRASRKQRELLLQGLMDTDGSIQEKNNQCSFTTTVPALAGGFAELLRSLGIKAQFVRRQREAKLFPHGEVCESSPCWQFSFTCGDGDDVFMLDRKSSIQRRARNIHPRRTKAHRIVSITPIDSVPVKCVEVDSPSHLYLAGESMIPTHNTHKTELVALAPKAPFVMEEGQVEGHEQQWRQANQKSYPYLLYKGTSISGKAAPPPQRQGIIGAPAGIIEAEQSAEQDMMGTTGVRFDATKSERLPEESGKALRELKFLGELGSFHYTSNFVHSLKYTAKIIIDRIPHTYDVKRVVTILREDDTEEQVTIDPEQKVPFHAQQGPKGIEKLYNPGLGKYDVAVTIGPNFQTQQGSPLGLWQGTWTGLALRKSPTGWIHSYPLKFYRRGLSNLVMYPRR